MMSMHPLIRPLLLVVSLFVLGDPLGAQEPGHPFLIADIHQAGESPYAVSAFVRVGDAAVFVQDKPSGAELWVTDGTDPGTRELGVECVDPDCRIVLGPSDGSRAFFTLSPGDLSTQLGVTDATPQGTRILTDFDPEEGPLGFQFSLDVPVFLGDRLLFAAQGAGQTDVWVSDGTAPGTRSLRDLVPDAGPFVKWAVSNGRFRLFFVHDGDSGFELWGTDGTAAGTVSLGIDFANLSEVDVFQSVAFGEEMLFFTGNQGSPNLLWITDGTRAGTRPFRELSAPDEPFVQVFQMLAGDDGLAFFSALRGSDPPQPTVWEVWRTDGTAAGTFPILEGTDAGHAVPLLQTVHRGILLFSWDDGVLGVEPYTSDGTVDGTRQVTDICPGPGSSAPRFLFTLGDDIVFRARDCERSNLPVSEVELWSVLGGPGPDLCPGPCSSDPELVAVADDGSVYLTADRGFEGRELWHIDAEGDLRSDLTRLTELPVREPFLGAPRPNGFQPDLPGTALADRVVFLAVDPVTGLGLYRTDGTPRETELVQTLAPVVNTGSSPRELTRLADEVVFVADDGFDPPGLWASDFTPAGTRPVEFEPGFLEDFSSPFGFQARGPYRFRDLQAEGSRLFFWIELPEGDFVPGVLKPGGEARPFAEVAVGGLPPTASDPPEPPPFYLVDGRFFAFTSLVNTSLTVTDGTPDGTRDFSVPVDSPFAPAAVLGDRLVFVGVRGPDPQNLEPALYSHDGIDFASRRIQTLPAETGPLTAAGDHLFFDVRAQDQGVWATDGTTAGTGRIPFQEPRPEGTSAIVPHQGRAFLFGTSQGASRLWVSDGTAEGSRLLADVSLLFTEPRSLAWASLDRELFFLDTQRPRRIWATDGTEAGTGPRNLLPADVEPLELHAGGGRLVLVARRGFDAPEVELWVSDGTPEGTRLLDGTFPQDSLGGFEGVGGRVAFAADGGEAGTELWGFATSAGTQPCAPGPRTLCLTRDRFRVQVEWHDPRSGDSGFGNVLTGATLADSGFLWFFDPDNLELVVKVLDARPVNGHFWVFTASLTDVERRITITDTVTGQVNVYEREAGNPTGHIDVTAF